MAEYNDIKKNYILNSLYHILVILIPIVITPYLTRTIGSAGLGEYAYYYSYAYYFALFTVLGIPNYGNRAIAKASWNEKERAQTFLEIYKLQVIASLCVTLMYGVFVHHVLNDNKVAWMFLGYVLSYILDISWFFFGMEEFKVTLTRNFIIKLVTIVLVLVMIKTEKDVYIYALITSMGTVAANLILIPSARKRINISNHIVLNARKHIKHILILFIPYLAVSIYKVMDKVMLGTMTKLGEVGFYESSERIINVPLVFVTSLGTVMMPRISNLISSNEKEKSEDYLYKSIVFMMFLSSSMCFGIVAIADIFVPIFFGKGFEKCILILTILMPSCVFLAFANVIRTQYLLPHEMDRQYVFALLCGAVINLALNLLLIPNYASIGASVGTLITEIAVCFFQCFSVRNYIPLRKYIGHSALFVLSGVLMSIIVRNVNININSLFTLLTVKILLGILIYFLILFVLVILWKLWNYISRSMLIK